jgi:hypothetical protein
LRSWRHDMSTVGVMVGDSMVYTPVHFFSAKNVVWPGAFGNGFERKRW